MDNVDTSDRNSSALTSGVPEAEEETNRCCWR